MLMCIFKKEKKKEEKKKSISEAGSKVSTTVSVISLCASGETTLTGRRPQQQGRETITLLPMKSLSESEHYLGRVYRQSNNSVLCLVSSHTAFQMARCGYALFHLDNPSCRVPASFGNSLPVWRLFQVPMTQTISWPFLKGKLLFFTFGSQFIFLGFFFLDFLLSSLIFLSLKIPLAG